MTRTLLIEDDAEVAGEIRADFARRGHHVQVCGTGPEGLAMARRETFDVLIVDRMLPELDGLSVIAALRAEGVNTAVLVLSALGAVDDRVRGLKAGGDDYLVKPFALEELAARVEALARRPSEAPSLIQLGPLRLDLIQRRAERAGRALDLLPTEFKLLEYFMRRPNRVVTRGMLLEDVWHYRFLPETNVVDVHIGKLRRKLDGAGEPPLLQTVRGAGFVLKLPG